MGWSSATMIFDSVCDTVLADGDKKPTPEETIRALAAALESADWDSQQESAYWENPVVRKVMKELHPHWDFDASDE